jgi:uncharacterized protein DUF6152
VKTKIALFLIFVCAAALPALAHHSFAAEFDGTKAIQLQGELTKLEWTNPHIWIYLDVKESSGSVTKWQCEGGAPNGLTRNGWTRDTLKAGDQIVIEGWLAKDGTKTCNARAVKLPDGKRVFAGSSNPEAK